MKGNRLRIVFLGTPAFAVPSLALLAGHHDVVAVVTAPDKASGRGLKPVPGAVRQYAQAQGIPVFQPERLRDGRFLESVRSLHPDLLVVVAFRMMPDVLWQLPPKGTINLHASLLPQYRGAAPIQHAILNGEAETGLTTFFLKHEIDTGNILFSRKVAIGPDETAGELHDRLMTAGAELLLHTVDAIAAGDYRETPQLAAGDGAPLKTAPKLHKADGRVNWNRPVADVHNQVRGLSPHPAAFTTLTPPGQPPLTVRLFKARPLPAADAAAPGTVATDGKTFLRIACADGWLDILEMQVPGKKRLPVPALLRGFRAGDGWHAGRPA